MTNYLVFEIGMLLSGLSIRRFNVGLEFVGREPTQIPDTVENEVHSH